MSIKLQVKLTVSLIMRYGTDIEDIVILIVTEQGLNQVFHKKKQDYLPQLKEAIENFNGNNNT